MKIKNFNFKKWLKNNKLNLVILFVLVIVSYANSLDNQFVSDDIYGIVNKENLGQFSYIRNRFPMVIRPILYTIVFKIFGSNPAFFRLINVFFHLGNVFLVYLIVSLLYNNTAALISSSLTAVHPILIEAVSWISGGPYSTYTFFGLAAFLFFILSQNKQKYYWFFLASLVFAFLTSPISIVIPIILAAFALTHKNFKFDWKMILPPLIIGLIAFIIFFPSISKRMYALQTSYYQKTTFVNPLFLIPTAITGYLELIFCPNNLTLYHSEINSIGQIQYTLRIIFFLLFIGLTIYLYFKKRKDSFWLMLFLIALGPFLTPFGISWLLAERYAYFSAIGVFVFIGILIDKINKKFKLKDVPIFFVLGLVVPLLTIKTIVRNNDWQNQDTLWIAAAKTSPSSPQNNNNLGDLYARKGNLQRAEYHFSKALQLKPGYADAHHNLANIYWKQGELNKAIENYQKALEINPNIWQSHQNLAAVYIQKEDYPNALKHLESGLEINPSSPKLLYNAAILYSKIGEEEKTKNMLEQILQIDPNNLEVRQLLNQF